MQFLAIYSSSLFKAGLAIKTYFLAMPMTIANEQEALATIHKVDRYYKDNFLSIEQFMQDADYDYHFLPTLANSDMPLPELKTGDLLLGVSAQNQRIEAIIPLNDEIPLGQWFSVEQKHLADYRKSHLIQTSTSDFKVYLKDEMAKDKTRAKRTIFQHYLGDHITIDFDASDPSKDNLTITGIDFNKTGPVPSRDFVALSCLYQNYQMHIMTLNNQEERTVDYRVNYYQNAFKQGVINK